MNDRILTLQEIEAVTGRSRRWLNNNCCSWCGRTLLKAALYGCANRDPAEDCEPITQPKPWWDRRNAE
jgi:hypothetical protein